MIKFRWRRKLSSGFFIWILVRLALFFLRERFYWGMSNADDCIFLEPAFFKTIVFIISSWILTSFAVGEVRAFERRIESLPRWISSDFSAYLLFFGDYFFVFVFFIIRIKYLMLNFNIGSLSRSFVWRLFIGLCFCWIFKLGREIQFW